MSEDMRSLNPDQLAAVRAVLPSLCPRDRLLWLTAYHCAARISECLALRIGDVWDGENVRPALHIARRNLKGGKGLFRHRVRSRTLPMHPTLAAAVGDVVAQRTLSGPADPEAPVFLSRQGRALCVMRAWQIFQRIYSKAGVPGYGGQTHVARRTAARALYSSTNHNLEAVRAALNHSSILTTQRYIRMSGVEAAKAFLTL